MTSDEALAIIVAVAQAKALAFNSPHAWDRMSQRGVQLVDIRHAIGSAYSCAVQENGRWRVKGYDVDGEQLDLIFRIEDGGPIARVTLWTVY